MDSQPKPEDLLRHSTFLQALARRLLTDASSAEDIVQEAYLAALERPPRQMGIGWLSRVVRNLAGKRRRSEKRRLAREHLATPRGHLPSPSELAARIEMHRRLIRAVDALAEPYRSTILLRFFYDLGPQEIAKRQAISIETVRTRLRRALAKLRGAIDRRGLALALLPLPSQSAWNRALSSLKWGLAVMVLTKRRAVVLLCLFLLAASTLLMRSLWSGPTPTEHATVHRTTRNGSSPAEPSNRTPGNDDRDHGSSRELVIRGIVILRHVPVPGATVGIHRAEKLLIGDLGARNYRRGLEHPAPPVVLAQTDAEGRFELRCAHRRRLTLEVAADGAATRRLLILPPVSEEVIVHLEAGRAISGIVVNEEDEPVPGALVRCRESSGRVLPARWETRTGSDGTFVVADLPRGPFIVRVDAEGYAPHDAFWRGPRVVLLRGGVVSGTVLTDEGMPVADATLLLVTKEAAETRTDAQGRYRIPELVPGHLRYALVDAPGRPPLSSLGDDLILPPLPVKQGEELAYDIVLAAGARLRGVLEPPMAGATVQAVRRALKPVVMARSIAGADGRFSFEQLPLGEYDIEAFAEGYLGRTLCTVPGEDVTVAMAACGRIVGRVRGLHPAGPRMTWIGIKYTDRRESTDLDAMGRFELEHAPLGKDVYAYLQPTGARSEAFSVDAGQTTEVEFDAAAGPAASGIVTNALGAPLPNALVWLRREGQLARVADLLLEGRSFAAGTDSHGRFRVTCPRASPGETLFLVAWHEEAAPAVRLGIRLPTEGVTLRLGAAHTVSGRIVWRDGSPVEAAEVRLNPFRDAPKERKSGVVLLAMWDRVDG
ncbi:MAG: sigma-70 family RNA polymerase sigma factor, partial [Planctomycetota bacterium]